MTQAHGYYSLTTNGEADWLISDWGKSPRGRTQSEFGFAHEVFNLFGEAAPREAKPMKTAKREDLQPTLF